MRIWMSEQTKENNRYAARVILPIAGAVLLFAVLSIAGVVLAEQIGQDKEKVIMLVYILDVILILWIAVKTGRSSLRNALFFCEDDQKHLFIVDVRQFVKYRRIALGYIYMLKETEKALERFKENRLLEQSMLDGSICNYAQKIVLVEKLEVNRKRMRFTCQVQEPQTGVTKRTYSIPRGYQNEQKLLAVLKGKKMGKSFIFTDDDIYEAQINGLKFVCEEFCEDYEKLAVQIAGCYEQKLPEIAKSMLAQGIESYFGPQTVESVMGALVTPEIDLGRSTITYFGNAFDSGHMISIEFAGVLEKFFGMSIDG